MSRCNTGRWGTSMDRVTLHICSSLSFALFIVLFSFHLHIYFQISWEQEKEKTPFNSPELATLAFNVSCAGLLWEFGQFGETYAQQNNIHWEIDFNSLILNAKYTLFKWIEESNWVFFGFWSFISLSSIPGQENNPLLFLYLILKKSPYNQNLQIYKKHLFATCPSSSKPQTVSMEWSHWCGKECIWTLNWYGLSHDTLNLTSLIQLHFLFKYTCWFYTSNILKACMLLYKHNFDLFIFLFGAPWNHKCLIIIRDTYVYEEGCLLVR